MLMERIVLLFASPHRYILNLKFLSQHETVKYNFTHWIQTTLTHGITEKVLSFKFRCTDFYSCHFPGFVPAPVIFGSLVDSSCLVWQKLCSGTGVCLHYDIEEFRLKLHGGGACFIFGALVFVVINYFIIRRLDLKFDENENTKEENDVQKGKAKWSKQNRRNLLA